MIATPYISIILPVRNEESSLPSLLGSLAQQDYPAAAFEVIVADGRSSDSTRKVVHNFAAQSQITVRLVDNPGIRSGPGRNAGVAAARGEFIIFIDGHCHLPSRSLLRDTTALFCQTGADCLCRPQPLLAPVNSRFGSIVAAVRASTLGHGRDSLIYDMNVKGFVDPASSGASYRRDIFSAIGEYDERFDACEDVEFNIRLRKAGFSAYTDPCLAVYYEPRTSLSSLFKQMIRYGRGRIRLMDKHRDCISLGHIAPAILFAWFAAAIAVALLPIALWMRLLLSGPVLLYLCAILASSFKLALKYGSRFFLQAILVYAAIHLGLGAGIWAELFSGFHVPALRKPSLSGQSATEC